MSSTPQIPLSLPRANPSLKDVLDALKVDIMASTNCHALATVQSVSQASNGLLTVNASINYSRTYFVRQDDGTYLAQQQSYPLLVDCPVIVLGGGAVSLNCPVAAGDKCLILFNDRDINNWWAGATSGPVASARLHSLSDAIALVGFNVAGTYDNTHGMLTNGNAQVGVSATASGSAAAKVRIANKTTTLYPILAQLIAAIEAMTMSPGSFSVTTSSASGTWPVTGVSGTVSSTSALEAAKTALQGLLE